MLCLCVLYNKDKRHGQDSQDKQVVQMKYREQNNLSGGEIFPTFLHRP